MNYNLNLTMFDGGAGSGAAGAGAAAGTGATGAPAAAAETTAAAPKAGKNADLSNVVYGKAPEDTAPAQAEKAAPEAQPEQNDDPAARFEKLINGEFKDLFTKKTQGIIDQRFKDHKTLQAKLEKLNPALELLANRYGVDPTDADKLAEALQNDDSYYEDEAMREGLTVEQLKEVKRLRRDSEQLQREKAEAEQKARQDSVIRRQIEESKQVAQIYPGFDLRKEMDNPDFLKLVHPDNPYAMDIKTAYEVVHREELTMGAIKQTAQQVQTQMVNDIQARGARPAENGLGGQSAAVIRKASVNDMSRADRDEVERRALRGERIRF